MTKHITPITVHTRTIIGILTYTINTTVLFLFQVNFGSLAEKAGLQVGDALVRVNGQDVYDVKHKDAQDVILGAGNAFELTIQR